MGAFASSLQSTGVPAFTPPEDEGHSVLGFLGNLVGGVKDVTLGLGKLLVAPAADLGRAVVEGLTFGKADLPGGYMTDDVIKGLAAMPQDYWDRYSPLLPGGRPASQILEELYQKPVSFGLDALAAASVAGKAASAAGAGKAAAAGIEAATPEAIQSLAKELGVSARTAKQVSVRGALESLSETPWYTKLLPEEKLVRAGATNPELIKTASMRNPLLRAGRNAFDNLFVNQTVDDFVKGIDERAAAFDLPMASDTVQNFIRRELEFKNKLPEGTLKVEKPWVYNIRDTTTAHALRNMQSSTWFADRFKDLKGIADIVKPKYDAMTPTERAASNILSFKGNVVVKGYGDAEDNGLMIRTLNEAPGTRVDVDLGATPAASTPLRTTLDPAQLEQAQIHEPGFDPTPALEFLDEYDNEIIPDVGGTWDAQKLKEESAATRDLLLEETEQIATGNASLQYRMDAQLHVKDLLDRADAIRRLEDTPLEMNERAMRALMISNGMWDETVDALPGVSLADANTAKQAILDHMAKVRTVRRKAERDVKSARVASKAERRGGVAVGMGEETVKRSAGVIANLEKRRQYLLGELEKYNQEIPLAEQGTHPLGNIAKNQKEFAKLTEQLNEVERKMTEGVEVPEVETRTPDQIVTEQTRMHPEGGILPEFMAKGGTPGRKFLLPVLREEVRQVLGDELGEKMLQGVMTLDELRERLTQIQLNPAPLAGEAWREVRDAMRAQGIQRPGYFPMVDQNRVKRGDWLARSVTKGVAGAMDPHEKWNSGTLLRRGTYMRDPLQARLIRASRHTKADAGVRYIEAVVSSKMGRLIQPGEHLAPDEVGIALEHVRGLNRISKKFYDFRLKRIADGETEAQATLHAIDDTVRNIQDRIAAGELDQPVTMYAVSRKVADKLNASARASGILSGPFAKIYVQGPMNVWRSLVLAGSPRWIVNNVLGNMMFSIMQGAPVGRMFHILEGRYAQILENKYPNLKLDWVPGVKSGKTLVDAINELFDNAKLDEGGMTIGQAVHSGGNPVEARMALAPEHIPEADLVPGPGAKIMGWSRQAREVPKGQLGELGMGARTYRRFQKIGDGVRAFNSEVETAARMNSALTAAERIKGVSRMKSIMGSYGRGYDRMNRIFKDGLTEFEARQVVKEMNHFLGDFTNLGPWERKIMRPYIFPFWGFYKHTAKLLLSYPFQYPERAVVLAGLANATQDMMDEYGPMPQWLESAMPLAPPGPGAQPFLLTSGPNPFSGLFQSPISGLSPLLKIPIEHFTGRSLFTGQKFTDKDIVTPFGTDQQFKIIRDGNGKAIDVIPWGKVTPSPIEAILGQIPQYETLKDVIAGGKTFDTSGLVDALKSRLGLAGGGLIKDPETGEAEFPVGAGGGLAKFLGFSNLPFDYEKWQAWLAEQQHAALTEAQKRVV